jgi:hypothetical protein
VCANRAKNILATRPPSCPLAVRSPLRGCRRSRDEREGLAEDGFAACLHDWPMGEHDPVEVPREDALQGGPRRRLVTKPEFHVQVRPRPLVDTVQAHHEAHEQRAPRIGRLYEVGHDEGAALLVVEHHLPQQPFSPEERLLEVLGPSRLRLVPEHPVEREIGPFSNRPGAA